MSHWAFALDESILRGGQMSLNRVELDETSAEKGTTILDNYSGTNGDNCGLAERTTATIEQAQYVLNIIDELLFQRLRERCFE
jgi:hypothetical protein